MYSYSLSVLRHNWFIIVLHSLASCNSDFLSVLFPVDVCMLGCGDVFHYLLTCQVVLNRVFAFPFYFFIFVKIYITEMIAENSHM